MHPPLGLRAVGYRIPRDTKVSRPLEVVAVVRGFSKSPFMRLSGAEKGSLLLLLLGTWVSLIRSGTRI